MTCFLSSFLSFPFLSFLSLSVFFMSSDEDAILEIPLSSSPAVGSSVTPSTLTSIGPTDSSTEALSDPAGSSASIETLAGDERAKGVFRPYYDLLKRNRNYRILFIANIISELGNWSVCFLEEVEEEELGFDCELLQVEVIEAGH